MVNRHQGGAHHQHLTPYVTTILLLLEPSSCRIRSLHHRRRQWALRVVKRVVKGRGSLSYVCFVLDSTLKQVKSSIVSMKLFALRMKDCAVFCKLRGKKRHRLLANVVQQEKDRSSFRQDSRPLPKRPPGFTSSCKLRLHKCLSSLMFTLANESSRQVMPIACARIFE